MRCWFRFSIRWPLASLARSFATSFSFAFGPLGLWGLSLFPINRNLWEVLACRIWRTGGCLHVSTRSQWCRHSAENEMRSRCAWLSNSVELRHACHRAHIWRPLGVPLQQVQGGSNPAWTRRRWFTDALCWLQSIANWINRPLRSTGLFTESGYLCCPFFLHLLLPSNQFPDIPLSNTICFTFDIERREWLENIYNHNNRNSNIKQSGKIQHQEIDREVAHLQPIGAGREWDTYLHWLRQIQSQDVGSTHRPRTAASTWARHQDGGSTTKVYLNIFELRSSVYIAIWASPSHNMRAIILPQDSAIHHHLLPEALSQTITYNLTICEKRVEFHIHLAGALHAVLPGVAHSFCNSIKVTLRKQHNNFEPLQHHLHLLEHLRQYIGRLQVQSSDWDIKDSNNIRDLNTRTSDCLHHSAVIPLGAHQSLRNSSTISCSTSSSDEVTAQQPSIYIGMIGMISLQEDIEEETITLHDLHQPHLRTYQASDFSEQEQQKILQHLRRQQEIRAQLQQERTKKNTSIDIKDSLNTIFWVEEPQHRHQQDAQDAQYAHQFQHFPGHLLPSYKDWCQQSDAHPEWNHQHQNRHQGSRDEHQHHGMHINSLQEVNGEEYEGEQQEHQNAQEWHQEESQMHVHQA